MLGQILLTNPTIIDKLPNVLAEYKYILGPSEENKNFKYVILHNDNTDDSFFAMSYNGSIHFNSDFSKLNLDQQMTLISQIDNEHIKQALKIYSLQYTFADEKFITAILLIMK